MQTFILKGKKSIKSLLKSQCDFLCISVCPWFLSVQHVLYALLVLHHQANLNNIIILSGIKENISTWRSCDMWWSGDVLLLQDLEEPWILPSADKILEDHVRSSVCDLKLTCIWVLQQGNDPIGVTCSKSWPESDRRRHCGVTLKRRCCSGWQPVISFRAHVALEFPP